MGEAHAHTLVRRRRFTGLGARRLAALVWAAGALLALTVSAAFGALIASAVQQRSGARAVARTTATVTQVDRVEQLAIDLETGVRGFVITGQEAFLAPYWAARGEYGVEARRLVALVGERPAQRAVAERLVRDGEEYARVWSDGVIAVQRRNGRAAMDIVATQEGKRRTDALRADLAGLREVEQRRVDEQQAAAERNATRTLVLAGLGLAGSLALLGAMVVYLRRRVTVPLGRVAAAAQRLESGESGVRVQEDGPREVAQLAASFNHMSDGLRRRGEDIERARAVAESASLAKNEFLSRMSHELRTPLNSVLGFGQLLQLDPDLGDGRREHVQHIVRGGQHLLELINEVLDISRIESGTLSLSPESVDVAQAVGEAVALVRPLAEERAITVRVDDRESGCVLADHQRLKQVLLNLLSNAIKYNRHGGDVTVICRRDGQQVAIEVADTGPGVPVDRLERLFEPFDRLGAERSGIEGTGLGLALSRSLVEVMDGTLTAANRAGEGACFRIVLPHAPAATALPAKVERPDAVVEASRVLYVEDNTANFRLVQELLTTRRPVEILPAIQGRLGVELAREHHPDVILLDLHLPDMTGGVVLAQLKADPTTADIPVVIVTADATPGRARRLVEEGAFACVTKPFDVPEFLRTVEAALAS